MKRLRARLDRLERRLSEGRLARFRPVFRMVDTFLYTTGNVTKGPCHVRDGLDLKRMMSFVVIALLPCFAVALYNTGYQANLAIEAGAAPIDGWRHELLSALGVSYAADDWLACVAHGAAWLLPVAAAGFAGGGAVEMLFAIVRRHDINEGFLVTGALLPLILPPAIPLWQVVAGTAFGVLLGKEVFGGTGMNFLNPALVCRAFLFFAYPADMSGNVWVAADAAGVDAVTGASPLGLLAIGELEVADVPWWDAFLGTVPGSMGETSALACAAGAVFLVVTRVASLRTMIGVAVGTALTASALYLIGSDTNPMFAVPLHYHLVLGGWAFGTVFMATDPVSSPVTERGRSIYGFAIGVLLILVRVVNPAYPEGTMLAILFMNVFAPLIDHFFIRANIRRRKVRYGRARGAA